MRNISALFNTVSCQDGTNKPRLKIQTEYFELNVLFTKEEYERLEEIRTADWSQRRCLKLGKSAGKNLLWSCEGGSLTILIDENDDSETWDIGFLLPESALDIILEARNL